MSLYAMIRPMLMAMEPEKAHRLTIAALKKGLGPRRHVEDSTLRMKLWGREFPNPLGMAAGFDKDAEVIGPLFDMGFGFVEAGTVTPLAQPGNPQPRVFRDFANVSIVNRMGFPGRGLEAFAANVAAWRRANPNPPGVLGVNIGINKETKVPFEDYKKGIEKLAALADYIVVNVSSPNTPGLRDLQAKDDLELLLTGLIAVRNSTGHDPQLLVKVAPDLGEGQRAAIAGLALAHHLDGLVISNTTVTRPPALAAELKGEAGGLSGALLKDISLEVLRDFYRLTEGKIPLIGVGGISSTDDAYARIRAGASLVQVYTGLVYHGPRMVEDILTGLGKRLRDDGFTSVRQAVGADNAPPARKEAV
ncbi:MAG: quinone-dependent dihydroorotate dehydrogenase [Alphaproteobacteria bacterium]|nr:quinone-dependent dihydroorotate dehydrogenase [Alphaproteobacteria bacterium]